MALKQLNRHKSGLKSAIRYHKNSSNMPERFWHYAKLIEDRLEKEKDLDKSAWEKIPTKDKWAQYLFETSPLKNDVIKRILAETAVALHEDFLKSVNNALSNESIGDRERVSIPSIVSALRKVLHDMMLIEADPRKRKIRGLNPAEDRDEDDVQNGDMKQMELF
jgi:hypothetical protein